MNYYLLCNKKWKLEIPITLEPKRISDISVLASATEILLTHVNCDDVKTVAEYFGGVGVQATVCVNMLRPVKYFINDKNEERSKNLKNVLWKNNVPNFEISNQDSYTIMGTIFENYQIERPYDLVFVNPPSFTLKDYKRNPKQLNSVFQVGSKYVVLVDNSKFHLHSLLYSKICGVKLKTREHYLEQYKFKGYGIKHVVSHFNAEHILFEKNYNGSFKTELLSSELAKQGVSKFTSYLE